MESRDARRSNASLEATASGSESIASFQDEVQPDTYMRHAVSRPGYALRYHGVSSYRLSRNTMHPVPPPYGCFSVPKFQFWTALEAVLALIFTNCFWVGFWDLLNNTVFPVDTTWDMVSLIVIGVLLLYFTNSLYEPPHPALPTPKTRAEKHDRAQNTQRTGSARGGGGAKAERDRRPKLPRVNTSKRLLAKLHPIFDPDPSLDIREGPFIPPRFEFWRLMERIMANTGSVCVWVGIWDQIDINLLPLVCSYKACGDCTAYGTFPCAWYKIGFTLVGLVGMYFTRQLYSDHEATYSARGAVCWQCSPKRDKEKEEQN